MRKARDSILSAAGARGSAALNALALAAILVFSAVASPPPAIAAPEDFGLETVDASISTTQAGAHPDLTLTFEVKQDPASGFNDAGFRDSFAPTRNIRFDLPPGLTGDPNVLGLPQQCTVRELAKGPTAECPNGSQVGVTKVFTYEVGVFTEPVYMMVPPGGNVVARLGFIAGLYTTFVDFRLDPARGNALTAELKDSSAQASLVRAETTTWGVPADPSHDTERMTPFEAFNRAKDSPPRPPGSRPLPFLTNPTRCGVPLELSVSASSWVFPADFDTATATMPPITGCDRLPFGASLAVEPTNQQAAAPTGLDLTLRLPAPDGVDVLETSHIRDVRIDLPAGMALNPSAADGLQACSDEQVKFGTGEPSTCPDAAKLGSAEFAIPALPRRMEGAIYLRTPQLPDHLFRIWVVADDQGAHIKLPGEIQLDPASGRISSAVLDLPQFPVREARIIFKEGFRSTLSNPPTCGTHFTDWEITPWSGTPPVSGRSSMTIDQGCGTGGLAPGFSAGTTNPVAARYSPFLLRLTRKETEQAFTKIDADLPPGLVGKLAGIPACPEAALASISSVPGTGQAEIDNPACPAASRLGHVTVGAGAGPTPFFTEGQIYLAGPYQGAPLSVAVVTPAVAGPLDLGTVVIRNKLALDPDDAQVHVRSDSLPTILEGIPLNLRDVRVIMDRQDFTLNPTNCDPMALTGLIGGAGSFLTDPADDISAAVLDRFQVGGCAALGFKPKLTLRLRGGTKRGAHPALTATLRNRSGDANIASVVTAFPPSEFLENAHIRTVCTRADFAASNCPAGAIYGHATVWTPLLDEPLTGNVYLRSSNNLLPDLVPDLRGPASLPVRIEAAGRTDSVNGGIRNSFDQIPDAPFSKLVLTLQGGRKGLLVNSRDICAHAYRATVRMTGHNGRKRTLRPKLKASCGKKGKKGKAKRSSHRRAGRVG